MNKRHPHGITGIDHPDQECAYFYKTGGMKPIKLR